MADFFTDQAFLWDCAAQLFYSENGLASHQGVERWQSLEQSLRDDYARRAIELAREHMSQYAHIPARDRLSKDAPSRVLSGG